MRGRPTTATEDLMDLEEGLNALKGYAEAFTLMGSAPYESVPTEAVFVVGADLRSKVEKLQADWKAALERAKAREAA